MAKKRKYPVKKGKAKSAFPSGSSPFIPEPKSNVQEKKSQKQSNRLMLGATAVGLSLSIIGFFAVSSKDKSDNSKKADTPELSEIDRKRNAIIDKIFEFAGDKQFLVFGDTDHRKLKIPEFVFSEAMIKKYAEENYKHIFIEDPYDMSTVVQMFYNGQISEKVFLAVTKSSSEFYFGDEDAKRRFYKAQCQLIKLAKKYGMHVHCSDIVMGGEFNPDLADIYFQTEMEINQRLAVELQKNSALLRSAHGSSVIQMRDAIFQYILKREGPEKAQQIQASRNWTAEQGKPQSHYAMKRYRDGSDPKVANFILEKSGSDKSIVMWGLQHLFRGFGDLDTSLGRERTCVVNVHHDLNESRQSLPPYAAGYARDVMQLSTNLLTLSGHGSVDLSAMEFYPFDDSLSELRLKEVMELNEINRRNMQRQRQNYPHLPQLPGR